MYANPAHIRTKRLNLSLNDAEMRAIEALSELNNKQPAAFIREVLVEVLLAEHGLNSQTGATQMRAAA
jgi:hypothetical protein